MKQAFILLIFFSNITCLKGYSQVSMQDSLVLVQLYNNTTPSGWKTKTNWNSANPVRLWYGITVANNRVTGINLNNNALNGSLPAGIGTLDSLITLDLGYNWIQGTLPASLGFLLQLKKLNIGRTPNGNYSDYLLTGNIPAELGNLTNLENLDLSFTGLTDTIPASLGNCVKLKNLNLSNTKISGSLPSSLGNLIKLETLNLSVTYLSGVMPSSFGNLTNLKSLNCGRPAFYGQGNLSGDLSFIGNLIHLKSVDMSYNKFTEIPVTMGNADSLEYINLSNNKLTGKIPVELGKLKRLTGLDLSFNTLSGDLPVSLVNCNALMNFNASNNELSGELPALFRDMSALNNLNLSHNKFNGSIPQGWNSFNNLQQIDISYNQLDGILQPVGKYNSMLAINCSFNQFTGTTNDFGSYTFLNNLDLSHNLLTGDITALKNLKINSFDLSNNQLSGRIPLFTYNYPDISNNKFLFDGMEEMVNRKVQLGDTSVNYAPQQNIPVTRTENLLYVSAGRTSVNNIYKWYKDNVLVATNTGDSSYTATATGNYNVVVSNAAVTKLVLYSDTISLSSLSTILCDSSDVAILAAGVTGSIYHWQVNTGSGFADIVADDLHYSGTKTASLTLSYIPDAWYGNEYRCIADGNAGNIFKLQFANSWMGSQDSIWDNAANWSCGIVPGKNTDVIINAGTVIVTGNTTIRSLSIKPGASLTVNPGILLTITH